MSFSPKFRRAISVLAAAWLLGVYLFLSFASVRPALADDGASGLPAGITISATSACSIPVSPGSTPCEGLNKSATSVDDKLIKPALQIALITAVLNLFTFVLDRLAYEAAIWVATGGEGETPLFNAETAEDAWEDFGLDIAGDAIGQLNDEVLDAMNIDFDICAPENPLFKLSLQLGLSQAYNPDAHEPSCDFQDIMSNWDSFISTTVETVSNPSQTVLKAFADGFKPGRNELSATVSMNLGVNTKVLEAKEVKLAEQVNSGGYKPVTEFLTGKVVTPAATLQAQFEKQIGDSQSEPTQAQLDAALSNTDLLGTMFLGVASTFTNTLLSTLMNRVFTGLFDAQPDVDPFDQELVAIVTREDAEARFASLLSTAVPSQISDYNILSEFITCPVGPVTVRSLNQCVVDSSFVSAVARSGAGTPITVQDAVDEGLLNGDWVLVSPDDLTTNQDPFCYSYAYCYGNLVKMRKARLISIGWEIAADTNSTSSPATLQEIIDDFDDETSDFYRLVDPNWVLKYPETQCRALVNGQLTISTLSPGRNGECVDTPSCLSEDNDGECDGGFGYCVQEGNTWRFRGEECPAEYASCMSFENADNGDNVDYLLNTVEYSVCDADNAGCEWYRTGKYYDDGGTTDDTSDDTYEWLAGDDDFVTADRDDDVLRYDVSAAANTARTSYAYDATGGTAQTYARYSYEDRIYFNNDAEECSEDAAGCSAVYNVNDTLVLNVVQNPSFETDEDLDLQPDGWTPENTTPTGTLDESGSYRYYGDNAYTTGADMVYQSNIRLAPGSFYTFSFYARQDVSAGTDTVTGYVALTDNDGVDLSLAGTSTSSGCAVTSFGGTDNAVAISAEEPADDEYERFDCTFTVPEADNGAVAQIWLDANGPYIDAVQLELGEDANDYAEGYNSGSPATSYLLISPSYLGCTGAATDPSECGSYTQVCEAVDVGCDLYTPEDGDPAVPAIASELDECPSECVGYATFKQEATDREQESFPLYFIADRATACTSQYVGCDEFTNLDALADGGEGAESYAYLRACVKPEMTGSASDDESATFFTWEGSDAAGYQLVTWTLLESDASDSDTLTFDGSAGVESAIGMAPCTQWDVSGEDALVCDDTSDLDVPADGDGHLRDIAANDECDEHDDIFDNPDCREFYDQGGNIHYRELPDTVAVDEDCHPYRYADSTEDDCEASGGFWTAVGECRYFGLPSESTECPVTQAGCREYTGGAGRNASTVFEDDFEDGALTEYYANAGVAVTVSNESLATGGHSMLVTAASAASVQTNMQFLDWSNTATVYDATDDTTSADTCSSFGSSHTVTDDGCEIDYGTGNACAVEEGDNNCGTLDDLLVAGKTYQLSFWAKGSGSLWVTMAMLGGTGTTYDFVDPNDGEGDTDAIALEGGWHEYALGPLDTSDIATFDDTAIIMFGAAAGETFYLDNVRLKAVEEDVTIIKDSWVVPAACDQTPDGAESDQYYLGCEAYSNQDGDEVDLYQFSDLCAEEVVGCEAVYDTQNSDSASGEIRNARCLYADAAGVDVVATTSTSCLVDGDTACTVAAGESFCLFDMEGNVPSPMPYEATTSGYFYMALGPEAVIVEGDMPMYLVDNGTTSCTAENAGCEEIGYPTYDIDKTNVVSFESLYFINDPDDYDSILCEDEALFCEEWSSTQDGNFYFKEPKDQSCEHRSSVDIDGRTYSGWFRTDTDEPCYADYLVSGEEYAMWKNGDDAYTGWIGQCQSSYDLCTEFRDESDTSDGDYPAGTPYYFLDDATLSEDALTASQQCQGEMSQKAGCALFNDTTDSELAYATEPSYVASTRADELFGDAPGSKQDPISCNDGGSDLTLSDGSTVNLCNLRCAYEVDSGVDLNVGNQVYSVAYGDTVQYAGGCLVDDDCPDLYGDDNNAYEGTCADVSVIDPLAVFENDANRILKVYRDRECSAWLSCTSTRSAWDASSATYKEICLEIGLCTQQSSTDSTVCAQYATTLADSLTPTVYKGRDTTWDGTEYSGYSIPNQLSIDHFVEVNINPDTTSVICTTASGVPVISDVGGFISADSEEECPAAGPDGVEATSDDYSGNTFEPDIRLVFDAGSCDLAEVGWEGACAVGLCEESGEACATTDECGSGDVCVTGYCQYRSATACASTTDADDDGTHDACAAVTGRPYCDLVQQVCVDMLVDDAEGCNFDTVVGCTNTSASCFPAPAFEGICVNNDCISGLDGETLDPQSAETVECRGNPEVLSPFKTKAVSQWLMEPGTLDDPIPTSEDDGGIIDVDTDEQGSIDALPYQYVSGYQGVSVCQPDETGLTNNDCVCSYDKVTYGQGGLYRYLAPGAGLTSKTPSICQGGSKNGAYCHQDATEDDVDADGNLDADEVDADIGENVHCGTYGTCTTVSRVDTYYGWDGYCLERDTSIHMYSSSDGADEPCLTWLPVDELASSTDLYGKFVDAGFERENTYYCSEVGYYADLYPTGSMFGADGSLSNAGDVDIDLACAVAEQPISGSETWNEHLDAQGLYDSDLDGDGADEGDEGLYGNFDCAWGEYDGCYDNVTCPENYVAIVGYCNQFADWRTEDESAAGAERLVTVHGTRSASDPADGLASNVCLADKTGVEDRAAADLDFCPFFCIPNKSRHISDDDGNAGDLCVDYTAGTGDLIEKLDQEFSRTTVMDGTLEYNADGVSDDDTPVFFAGDLFLSDVMTDDGTEVNTVDFFKDCAIRGLPYDGSDVEYEGETYVTDWYGDFMNDGRMASDYVGGQYYSAGGTSGMADGDPKASLFSCNSGDFYVNSNLCRTDADCSSVSGPCSPIEYDDDDDSSTPSVVFEGDVVSGRLRVYPGCYEVVQASTDDGDFAEEAGGVHNKAWTNRLLNSASTYATDADDSLSDYGASMPPTPAGQAAFDRWFSRDSSCEVGVDDGCVWETIGDIINTTDPWPVPVYACDLANVEPGKVGLSSDGYGACSDPYGYPGSANFDSALLPMPYDDFDESDESDAVEGAWDPDWNPDTADNYSSFGDSSDADPISITEMLSQFFQKAFRAFRFHWNSDAGGSYVEIEKNLDGSDAPDDNGTDFDASDYRGLDYSTDLIGDELDDQQAPTVMAVEDCEGNECREGQEGTFSVNELSEGNVEGTEGQKHVTVSFFAFANSNHMPIRQINMDWGDSDDATLSGSDPDVWYADPVGSTAPDNYYRNYRGWDEDFAEICGSEDAWGYTSESCSSSYLTFTHDYVCSANDLETLVNLNRVCQLDAQGALLNSPCVDSDGDLGIGSSDACVYQPRVHVRDNWGWCTGYCDSEALGNDGTPECYAASLTDECDASLCPGIGCSPDGDGAYLVNPWINFDGYIVVTPP